MPVCTGVLAEEELRLKWITAASHPSPPAVEGVCRVPGEGRTPVDRGGVRTVDRQALAGSTPGRAGIVARPQSDPAIGADVLEGFESRERAPGQAGLQEAEKRRRRGHDAPGLASVLAPDEAPIVRCEQ